MRLDFNILWVEDQEANVLAQKVAIDRRIRNEGFRVQVVFARSVDEATAYLADDVYGDHIDLILMDYDLGAGRTGDEGLIEIRNKFPYKDVVFYSARAADLGRLVADKRIEGIFCSGREELPDTVVGVFEALIKKVLDIDHARGIVMGSSSEIDGLVLDCLTAHFGAGGDVLSDQARAVIVKRLKDIRKDFEDDFKAVEAATKMAELAELHRVYSSIDRLNLLRKLLAGNADHTGACEAMKGYAVDTIPKRNVLAHVRTVQDGFSRKLIDKNGAEWTAESVRALRRAVLEHQENLEALVARLRGG